MGVRVCVSRGAADGIVGIYGGERRGGGGGEGGVRGGFGGGFAWEEWVRLEEGDGGGC